jgi:hypothetical protein
VQRPSGISYTEFIKPRQRFFMKHEDHTTI